MPTVPLYEQTERRRPILRQGIDVQASPGDFGAQIGQATQNVAQGLGNIADVADQVRELKATTDAKDRLTAMEREKIELDYGQNGFLTTQGRNAVEGRSSYNTALEALKKKYTPEDPIAARKFGEAATAVVTQGMRSGIVHSAQGQKDWVAASSSARMELLKDQALNGYDKPNEIKKSLGLGYAEIGAQAELMGWDQAVVDYKRKEFSSSVHSSVALALASKPNGARGALDYIKQNGDSMDPKVRLDMESKLRPYAAEEEGLSVVNEIMSQSRKAAAASGTPTTPSGGPTQSKAFLASKSVHKDRPGDTLNLDDAFADNLAALIQDAPASIREGLGLGSAYRSNEHQEQLFANSDRTGRTVAFPAGYQKPNGSIAKGSNHLHGRAVDLTFKGSRLDRAPKEVRDWVHDNAANYGLRFPMSYEPWHIEPVRSGTVVPSREGVAARSTMPSYDDAMQRIGQISDPDVRASAMKQLNAQYELRSKAETADSNAAKSQIWSMVLQDTPMSQIPLELKISAGREAVSGFMEFENKADAIKTDPAAYSSLSNMAAADPAGFAKLDLTEPEIINSLSREDWKAMSNKKSAIIGDETKAVQEGKVYQDAFKQAEVSLNASGVTTTGIKGDDTEARMAMERRIAQFQNEMRVRIDDHRARNDGRLPTYVESQQMINELLLPIVTKTPGTLWGTNEEDGKFLFEAPAREDGTAFEIRVPYQDIPIDLRQAISTDLLAKIGRKPTPEEVSAEYVRFLTSP
jgi:LAS superfamily LD-carboxypeptidase LdcB